jgi:hypothetical protein
MCDYSMHHVQSRPAAVDDKLVVTGFACTFTTGFRAEGEDKGIAVCLRPGTELSFSEPIVFYSNSYADEGAVIVFGHETRPAQAVTFRQIHLDKPNQHHDAIEFADGEIVLVQYLERGHKARVLQLPAETQSQPEAKAQGPGDPSGWQRPEPLSTYEVLEISPTSYEVTREMFVP